MRSKRAGTTIKLIITIICLLLVGYMGNAFAQGSAAIKVINTTGGGNVTATLRNVSNNAVAANNIMTWTNAQAGVSDWKVADQYLELTYSNLPDGWGMEIYSNNKRTGTGVIYTGTGNPAGLIKTDDTRLTIPVVWLITHRVLTSADWVYNSSDPANTYLPVERSVTATGSRGFTNYRWHYMKDINTKDDAASSAYDESFRHSEEYVTLWNQRGIAVNEGGRASNPKIARVYFAAKFSAVSANTVYKCDEILINAFKNISPLPFCIYKEPSKFTNPTLADATFDNHFAPAIFNYKAGVLKIEDKCTVSPRSGKYCMKLTWTGAAGPDGYKWTGLQWLEPSDIWTNRGTGQPYNGYDIRPISFTKSGAIRFYTRTTTDVGNTIVTYYGNTWDSCGQSTAAEDINKPLKSTWQEHTVPLPMSASQTMTNVTGALAIILKSELDKTPANGWTMYLDDIEYIPFYETMAPAEPSNLISTGQSLAPAQIALQWQDNSGNETGFYVFRKLSGAASYTWIGTTTTGVNTYTDTGVSAGNTYVYCVKSYNSIGTSAASNELIVELISKAPTFTAPYPPAGSSLAGSKVSFAVNYHDQNGYTDIKNAYFAVSALTDLNGSNGSNSLVANYNPVTKKVNVLNLNADGSSAGTWSISSIGTGGTAISNSFFTVHCSEMQAESSLYDVAVKWVITFNSSFAGQKYLHCYAKDNQNLYSGWTNSGNWKIDQNYTPTLAMVAPSVNGSSIAGSKTSFTAKYSDANGNNDINITYFGVSALTNINGSSGANSLVASYNPLNNKIAVLNLNADGSSAGTWSTSSPGGTAISNTFFTVHCDQMNDGTEIIKNGNDITVKWIVTFNNNFTGQKYVHCYAKDNQGAVKGWDNMLSWRIDQNYTPSFAAPVPSSGAAPAGTKTSFSITYSDQNGYADLRNVWFAVTPDTITSMPSASGYANCLLGYYDANTNEIAVLHLDSSGSPGTTYTWDKQVPGGAAISNTLFTIHCDQMRYGTEITSSGNNTTIKWVVTFSSAAIGQKNMFCNVKDDQGVSKGWNKTGTWKVDYTHPPTFYDLNPASGSGAAGQEKSFTINYKDEGSWSDISKAMIAITPSTITDVNTAPNYNYCFIGYYLPSTNEVGVLDLNTDGTPARDANNQLKWLKSTMSNAAITDTFFTVHCNHMGSTNTGEHVIPQWNITFNSNFKGSKNIHLYVKDKEGASKGWEKQGTWTVN